MSNLRVHAFSISLDGYGAGVNQGLKEPLGENGEELHEWIFPTRTFKTMYGDGNGTTGIDDDFVKRGFENLGAWIMGRNMFGPSRGDWPDDEWRGWWGENPPYHVPVFVLTHHARGPIEMEGGTTFHFVTGGIEAALERAREAAGPRDIRLGGGASTIRQYLRARLVDSLHYAISPVLLGAGEPLFHDVDLRALGYKVTEQVQGEKATHVVLSRGG
jgi:dihydrofolate reductase